MRRALVCGVAGQDGAYLASLLLEKGYEVFGSSRDWEAVASSNLGRLGIEDRIKKISMTPSDPKSVDAALSRIQFDEIYNLSAQSSVGRSFEIPTETINSILLTTQNLLEVVRRSNGSVRLYTSSSGDCFGDTGGVPANEDTPFRPRSPYAVAKAAAHNLVATYREAYGVPVCAGITFNHESPLRSERFVTQKIVMGAARIAARQGDHLTLGTLETSRDWGWAPEYVEGMWRMLQRPSPADYVLATGRTVNLRYVVERAFEYFGLNWENHVHVDSGLSRPWDPLVIKADPSRAARELGWKTSIDVETVITNMCKALTSLPSR